MTKLFWKEFYSKGRFEKFGFRIHPLFGLRLFRKSFIHPKGVKVNYSSEIKIVRKFHETYCLEHQRTSNLLYFPPYKMEQLKVFRPIHIPSETSHYKVSYWEISSFSYDRNTKCYLGDKEIPCEMARELLRNGTYSGIAFEPLKVSSSEFRNGDEVAIITSTIFGMLIVGATLVLFK